MANAVADNISVDAIQRPHPLMNTTKILKIALDTALSSEPIRVMPRPCLLPQRMSKLSTCSLVSSFSSMRGLRATKFVEIDGRILIL